MTDPRRPTPGRNPAVPGAPGRPPSGSPAGSPTGAPGDAPAAGGAPGSRRLATPARILRAAAQQVVEGGAANLSMQDVADTAGVSKGLIHYHFHDKETLLARLVEWATRETVSRERSALTGSTPATAIEDHWTWLAGELERGHLRLLVELAQERAPAVAEAVRAAAVARREAAASTLTRLFGVLQLTPRVPVELLADVVVAFADGLAVHATVAPAHNHRVAFDIFWLSLLSLAE